MPANLTPQYQAAEERFRKAQTIEEKIEALREMMSTIPKHKGTEKLQADIKRKLSKYQDELDQRRRGGAKGGAGRRHDPGHIPKEGAGQVAMIGPPNAGRSSLLAALTNAHPEIADYPYTTKVPLPGMMPFEDAQVQIIDTPPLAGDFDPLLVNVARNADAVTIVMDPADAEGLEHAETVLSFLHRCRIVPQGRPVPEEFGISARVMPVLLVMNKCDLDPGGEVASLIEEAIGSDLPVHRTSARSGEGLEALREALFRMHDVIRVYAKEPGKKPDMDRPFVLKRGATVFDLATLIHKDIAARFQFARIWGSARFGGQPVERDHPLEDKDIVEIHA